MLIKIKVPITIECDRLTLLYELDDEIKSILRDIQRHHNDYDTENKCLIHTDKYTIIK